MTLFDKYSFKQKNFALLILAILLFAAAYKRSFKTTIETRSFIQELNLKLIQGRSSLREILILQKEISNLNELLGKENVSIEEIQQGFLNFFATNSSQLAVQQIDEVYTFEHPDFKINTFKIDVKGDFISILKFIHIFELQFQDARLIHTHFENSTNDISRKNELITTLLIQNYVQKS